MSSAIKFSSLAPCSTKIFASSRIEVQGFDLNFPLQEQQMDYEMKTFEWPLKPIPFDESLTACSRYGHVRHVVTCIIICTQIWVMAAMQFRNSPPSPNLDTKLLSNCKHPSVFFLSRIICFLHSHIFDLKPKVPRVKIAKRLKLRWLLKPC